MTKDLLSKLKLLPIPTGYAPYVFIATLWVAVLPVAAVALLESRGLIRSVPISILLTVAFSAAASFSGSWLWMKHRGAQDVVFGDLMIWGWLRRAFLKSRISKTSALLARADAGEAQLGPETRLRLLTALANSLESGDPYTHGHSRRVARHSYMIAKNLGLGADIVSKIRLAATVHDVGKLRIPQEVLHKTTKLTDEEFEIIKEHPAIGAEMVEALSDPELTDIVRHHHERMDGRGYPDRLHGVDIPIGARVIAVADTFDALSSTRSYRAATSHKKAIALLKEEAGSQLDQDAVSAFLRFYSGRRWTMAWTTLANVVQRTVGWASRTLQGTSPAGLVQTAASIGAAAVMVTTAVLPPLIAGESHGPAAMAAEARAGSTRQSSVRTQVGTVVALAAPSDLLEDSQPSTDDAEGASTQPSEGSASSPSESLSSSPSPSPSPSPGPTPSPSPSPSSNPSPSPTSSPSPASDPGSDDPSLLDLILDLLL